MDNKRHRRKRTHKKRADSWSSISNTIDYTVRHQDTIVKYHGEFKILLDALLSLSLHPSVRKIEKREKSRPICWLWLSIVYFASAFFLVSTQIGWEKPTFYQVAARRCDHDGLATTSAGAVAAEKNHGLVHQTLRLEFASLSSGSICFRW